MMLWIASTQAVARAAWDGYKISVVARSAGNDCLRGKPEGRGPVIWFEIFQIEAGKKKRETQFATQKRHSQ